MPGRERRARQRRADLSQHFLREARAAGLIRATPISKADLVIEIGPGRGALTQPLIARAGRVVAVEADGHLARKLEAEVGHCMAVVRGDFLRFRLPDEPYRVVGNIPYSISTEIVRKLVEAERPPEDAWLIVQRELAQRLCGRPYTTESLWSLRLKPRWHLEILDHLKRTDFDPPPSVDSVLLWMCSRGRALLSTAESRLYGEIIAVAFQGSPTVRQALRPWLSKLQLRRLATDLRFDPQDSPSLLLFEQWLGIVRFVSRRNGWPCGTAFAGAKPETKRQHGGRQEIALGEGSGK